MTPVVVDASAVVDLLLTTDRAAAVRQAVGGSVVVAPDVLNPEVVSALRRAERAGTLGPARARLAVGRLVESSIRRFPSLPLVRDAWELRVNVTAYDALYVALARRLGCPLVTADARLARAPGLGISTLLV